MNKLIITSVLIFNAYCSIVFCQNKNIQKELLKSYTQAELTNFSTDDINLLEYAYKNGMYLTRIPEGKKCEHPEIEDKNGSLCFTDYGLKIMDKNQYYRIKNTDKILVLKSNYVLKNEILTKKANIE